MEAAFIFYSPSCRWARLLEWVDYLDPDYVLKVSYAHTVQERS